MGQTPRHSVSVAAVILDDTHDQVLLIQRRDNGRGEPPGGVLELEEAIEDGLRREVRDESVVEVEIEALAGVYKNMTLGIVALVYRCSATTKPHAESEEATAVRWHGVDTVGSLMPPAYAVRIRDAIAAGPVATREHDGINLLGHPVA